MIGQESKAFIDAMKSEHRDLGDMVHRLELLLKEAVGRGWPGPLAEDIWVRLQKLERVLADHFAREEQGGFLEEALAHAPRFGPQAEHLLSEHVTLLACVRYLVREAELNRHTPSAFWQVFADALAGALRQLLAHEAQENALLQKAFNADADIVQ
ncbi:MAG: hemerythrin domain-containing protein [Planctomycetia bacterium]|nr:hemerythrin domain-containing protein [Planctomycetia bacterium]